jgi:serine/threonine protein phosphatase PrpC
MKIELYKPLSIFGQGKRDNMEDCIFPAHRTAKETDPFFIVCDGMGGHTMGETASKLACEGFAGYFVNHPTTGISEQYFLDAFNYVQDLFDSYEHNETRGMGTTLVMLYFSNDFAAVTHCGDSRFYHFSGPGLIWRTEDHKLVNEWVRCGLISAHDALIHAKSNIISRAIQGNNTLKTKPDIHFIYEIKPGDYFLLCTDGLYESITDEQLGEIISAGSNDDEKLQIIQELCEGNSKDNYSAFFLKIKNII